MDNILAWYQLKGRLLWFLAPRKGEEWSICFLLCVTYQASTEVDGHISYLVSIGLNEFLHHDSEVIILCLTYYHQ